MYEKSGLLCWDISTFQLWAIFPFQAVTGLDAKPAESQPTIHTAPKRYIVTMGKNEGKLPYASNARWAIPSGKKKQVRLAGLKLHAHQERARCLVDKRVVSIKCSTTSTITNVSHTRLLHSSALFVCLFSTKWAMPSKSISLSLSLLHADHFRK